MRLNEGYMENLASCCFEIFYQCVEDYHTNDDPWLPFKNRFYGDTIQQQLYSKNWIDGVQWHIEDLIRDPDIAPEYALRLKREIDRLNQERTNTVEAIDNYLYNIYKNVNISADAKINTESLGWAIDRLSILTLKLYHIQVELQRKDSNREHLSKCKTRFKILVSQKEDLVRAIDWLVEDIQQGSKVIKVYKQLKMYNEIEFNPVLYTKR